MIEFNPNLAFPSTQEKFLEPTRIVRFERDGVKYTFILRCQRKDEGKIINFPLESRSYWQILLIKESSNVIGKDTITNIEYLYPDGSKDYRFRVADIPNGIMPPRPYTEVLTSYNYKIAI